MGEVQAANASQVGPVPIMNSHLWTDRRLTIRVVGPDGERTIDVNKPYARIGSHPRSEVILEGADVPKHGLYLHATDRGIFSVQLWDSSDEPATYRGWVTPNQGIPLGECQIFASFTDGPAPVADPDGMLDEKGSAQLPVPVIYLLVNEERRATYRVYRSLTVVGREKPSALRLRSDYISLTHCVLYWQDGKLWFVDLLSSNGTEKRGRRCEAERFRLGRTIKIGDVLLGFARTTSDPWDASSTGAMSVREATPPTEPKHIFELNAPQPADARLWSTGDGSSLHNIDGLEDSWEEHGDSDARLDKDAVEAIQEMRRQLEAERTAWESERLEKERVLADKHRELDRSFAEIQSWRDELSFRSHQLEHDLVAKKSAHLAADQAALEDDRQTLAREREELEEQIAQWKVWQKTTSDEHAAISAAHRLESESLERRQAELTALAADLECRRQQWDADLARKRQQIETDLERQRVQLETDLAAFQGRQQAFDAHCLSVTQQNQSLAAQQQELAALQQNLTAQQEDLLAERTALEAARSALAAEQAQLASQQQTRVTSRSQLDADRRALAVERQELASQLEAIAAERAQLDSFRATFGQEQQELESLRQALVTDRAQLDDCRVTLSQEQLELEAQRKTLAADRQEWESLSQAHAAESAQLEADRRALTAERKELESRLQLFTRESNDAELTRQELETLRRELHAEQQTLAALRQELDISRQSLESERAEIALLRQSAIGASTARGAELEQQHRALSELRLEIADQQRALESQREQWEAEQRQSIAEEQQRLATAQLELESATAEQTARIADAERRLLLREEQMSAAEARLHSEFAQLAAARQELEQAQVALHERQRELQQQSEAFQQAQTEAHQRLAERQKDVDALTAELLAQQSVLAAERQELTTLCQSLNQDRERAQAEMQEQRAALLATRQEIEALQSQLARDRDASTQIQAALLAQRQQMDEQLQQLRDERESLSEERRELDGERQRLEQFAIEQTELLAMIERERDLQPTDDRPRLAQFDDETPAFAHIADDLGDDTLEDDDDHAVQQSLDYEPVADRNYSFERVDEVAEQYDDNDDAASEEVVESIRCEHEYDHELPPDQRGDAIEEHEPGAVVTEMAAEMTADEAAASYAADLHVDGTDPTMGQQFEQVDPVLLGEPRTSANPDAADDASNVPPRPVERIPVDPAADAAYDQLVDRLVQFQQSQKRKWFKFW